MLNALIPLGMRFLIYTFAFLASTVSVSAGQAYSKSLTQCSALYSVYGNAEDVVARLPADKVARFHVVADAYLEHAKQQAAKEGVVEVAPYIAKIWTQATSDWEVQTKNILKIRDTEDWINYCRSFGKNLGLPLIY